MPKATKLAEKNRSARRREPVPSYLLDPAPLAPFLTDRSLLPRRPPQPRTSQPKETT